LPPGVVFGKHWTPQPGRPHVDFGRNAEVYTNDKHVELETLGPGGRWSMGRHGRYESAILRKFDSLR
jgi:hypothetical protein